MNKFDTKINSIYSTVSSRLTGALMFHSQLTSYFRFISLEGFAMEQLYHYYDETMTREAIQKYAITHSGVFVFESNIEDPLVIPKDWYNKVRNEVDPSSISKYVANGLAKWCEWEEKSLSVYEEAYTQLLGDGHEAEAIYISKLVEDVLDEFAYAEEKFLSLDNMGFDMPTIVAMQKEIKEEYSKKIQKLFKEKAVV